MSQITRESIRAVLPIRAFVDSCVFPQTTKWIGPLLDASKTGYVVLYWSPLVIAESNRVLTWLWLKRHRGDFSDRSWQRCSVDFKRMFARLTEQFHVVDDRPPAVPSWEKAADEWDVPIWTAAKRCDAHFIITENLVDGPPADADGNQEFEGISFVHPDEILKLLGLISEALESAALQAQVGDPAREQKAPSELESDETTAGTDIPSVFQRLADEPWFQRLFSEPRDDAGSSTEE